MIYGDLRGCTTDIAATLQDVRLVTVSVGGIEFGLLQSMPRSEECPLPLPSHEPITLGDAETRTLQRAIQHLAETYEGGFDCLSRFVRLITWVRLAGGGRGEVEITSASFPEAPLWIFMSAKAPFHLPPAVIGERPSARFLAENLYHEAVHQAVNAHLLLGRVLAPSYDTRTSPKVTIPWRAEASPRNREWEIDRVFHAATVYDSIMAYRASQLSDPRLEPFERKTLEAANVEALDNLRYLVNALVGHRTYFTEEGIEIVDRLNSSAGRYFCS